MPRLFPILFLSVFLTAWNASAQNLPIGQWKSYYPYNHAYGVATDGVSLYVAAGPGMFSHNSANGSLDADSKVTGMADVGTTQVGYDDLTETAIIGYSSSNIDLLHKDGTFTNVPDLRLKTESGSKRINAIIASGGVAYISTDIGVVLLNIANSEVSETWKFSQGGQIIPITSLAFDAQYFYTATPRGLYRALRTSTTLRAFSTWTRLPGAASVNTVVVAGAENTVYASGIDSLFAMQGGTLALRFKSDSTTTHLDAGKRFVYLSGFRPGTGGYVLRISAATGLVADSFKAGIPRGIVETADTTVWVADEALGLAHLEANVLKPVHPDGPDDEASYDILPYNGDVWVAHGGFNDISGSLGNASNMSHLRQYGWAQYHQYTARVLTDSGITDVVAIARDPADGAIFGGTVSRGIMRVAADGEVSVIGRPELTGTPGEPGFVGAPGVAFDQGGNLWVTQHRSAAELAVRTPTGEWYHHSVFANRPIANAAAGILVDDLNQKWYYGPQSGGAFVYDDKRTPENSADDVYRQFTLGKGLGNLPSSRVLCLAKDREGTIWIGTDNGIGIINCPGEAAAGTCEAELRPVQFDQFAGYLFQNEAVATIAVDGANRKWVGTSNGVWLMSASGLSIISRFTAANSPLPSDRIQKIAVDPITGDVYIGTDAGLVSYRGTATDADLNTGNTLLTFPNPVPSGYSGTIAIRGFSENADVRITDIAGQLVYRTTANGGQATWNGLDYTGHRPQSGVYLVFGASSDGVETRKGKMIFMK